ncbi:MBL fold metallo-hydrolase [Lacrimispora saccharolytica]|uniref:Beta-lactamase n=1 Tax=Lacrimispora saccharolytica (strain ATCC 35040 / DSM 2544 / NRCC 2533 / WM1) TaxID=610130 RepID=D9R4E6_LACSW|nr:MBL fold metallo-hydrolase [Lacrimispora saccharolytica]ADL05016.1 beta-lactamase [[Clostridium] saccharolyticum WM1]QRV20784.1 MBL fold metallo-hydrolase [Lacrimispora saccharolytica]
MAEIKRIRCGNVNTYLIEEHGRAILVDTGRIGSEEKILAQCQKTKVELIVLTHGHVDHVQNTACLKKELGVPVALHKKDLNLIKDGIHEPLRYQGFLGMVVAEVSAKSYETDRIPEFTPDIYLKEGEWLKDYGVNGRIIELPGHTRGSIGIDLKEKAVIVGDALMNMFYPGLSMIYWNREEMIRSAEKISALGARKVYFGHGSPVENRAWNKAEI